MTKEKIKFSDNQGYIYVMNYYNLRNNKKPYKFHKYIHFGINHKR